MREDEQRAEERVQVEGGGQEHGFSLKCPKRSFGRFRKQPSKTPGPVQSSCSLKKELIRLLSKQAAAWARALLCDVNARVL